MNTVLNLNIVQSYIKELLEDHTDGHAWFRPQKNICTRDETFLTQLLYNLHKIADMELKEFLALVTNKEILDFPENESAQELKEMLTLVRDSLVLFNEKKSLDKYDHIFLNLTRKYYLKLTENDQTNVERILGFITKNKQCAIVDNGKFNQRLNYENILEVQSAYNAIKIEKLRNFDS